jgi:hypothetical protein
MASTVPPAVSISTRIAWEATSGSTIIRGAGLSGGFQRIVEMPDGGLRLGKLGEIGFRLDAGLALVDEQLRPPLKPG